MEKSFSAPAMQVDTSSLPPTHPPQALINFPFDLKKIVIYEDMTVKTQNAIQQWIIIRVQGLDVEQASL